ncbi:ABC transporter ATP-binding protein [Aquibacillus sediminis]|uniref:ABC transporter ATP-binding protein n=1 Tax=Aquibacillus sediminis TaxID=2574734 RepID=UPI001108D6FF|nr:ABC transporter ATP-binding protein [Aquibacillus sediminis]
MDPYIQLKDVGVTFGKDVVLQRVDLSVEKQGFVSIVGKSGTGKTTLIKMVAGMLAPTEGEVWIQGEKVKEPHHDMTYVFQKPVLLEWRTLLENILLPIELKRKPTQADRDKAKQVLALVELAGDEHKYPHECSGGMLSRAALARALFTSPNLLLMDEPYAALDAMTKELLQVQLLEIAQDYNPTVIFITHDIQEAAFLSDRVILIGDQPSRVMQEYTIPFHRPRKKTLKFEPEFLQVVKQIYQGLETL